MSEGVVEDPDRERLGLPIRDLAVRPTVYGEDILAGQRLLISGGGSGIGQAAAFLAARLGASVMICGRNEDRLIETAEAISRRVGREVHHRAMTIRDPEQVQALANGAWERLGGVDTLVNSAGGQFLGPSLDYTVKGWHAVVDTNLNGTWWMMQAVAQRWRDNDLPGNVVNIVNIIDRGMPYGAHTAAARAGVVYLSKSVAVEWAPLHIRVNCLGPGAVISTGWESYPEENNVMSEFTNSNPMRRWGETWDVAETIVYLSCSASNFMTGEYIHLDGGQNLWTNRWLRAGGPPEWFRRTDEPSGD